MKISDVNLPIAENLTRVAAGFHELTWIKEARDDGGFSGYSPEFLNGLDYVLNRVQKVINEPVEKS